MAELRPKRGTPGYNNFKHRMIQYKARLFHSLTELLLRYAAGKEGYEIEIDLANDDNWMWFRWWFPGMTYFTNSANFKAFRVPRHRMIVWFLIYVELESHGLPEQGHDRLFCSLNRADMGIVMFEEPHRGPVIPGSNDWQADRNVIQAQYQASPQFMEFINKFYLPLRIGSNHVSGVLPAFEQCAGEGPALGVLPPRKKQRVENPKEVTVPSLSDMGMALGLGSVSFPPYGVLPDTGGPSTGRAVPYRSPTATVSVPPPDVSAPQDLLSQALAMSELDYDVGEDAGAVAGEDYGDMGMTSGLGSVSFPPYGVLPDTGGPSTGRAVPYRSPTATVSVAPPDVAAPQDLLSQALAMSELDYDVGEDAGAVAGEDDGDILLPDPGESSHGPGVPFQSPTPPVSVPVHDVAHIPHDYDYDVLSFDPFNEGAFANPEQDDEVNPDWLEDNWLQEFEAQAAQHDYGVPPPGHLNEGAFSNQEQDDDANEQWLEDNWLQVFEAQAPQVAPHHDIGDIDDQQNILQNIPSPDMNVLEPWIVQDIDRDELEDLGDIQEYLDEL